jgi:TonB family protein
MILSSMLFLLAVSVLAGAAAVLVDTGLRRMGVATRYAWLGAMAAGPVFLGARVLDAIRPGVAPAPPPWAVVELPGLTLAPGPAEGLGVEGAAAVLWILSGLALAALVMRTHRVLLGERAGWESTQLMGRDVFVSTDRGPAVAGVWDPWIVLPRWVLDLPETELHMVLLHEEEHVRARDALLLGSGLAWVVLSAWNPVTWWQLRRLRTAMEMDCDRRVLHRAPDRVVYGSSLLSVAARASGASLGLAAFTERSLSLKRRIVAMTTKTSRWTSVGGGVLVVLGAVVGVQACGVDGPVDSTAEPQATTEAPALAPEAAVSTVEVPPPASSTVGDPSPTPFTVAPAITNRDDVIAALEADYPPLLREAGVGGTVRLYFFIDEEGRVADVRVDQSSGHPALDEAALKVATSYRFTPALNKDKKVPVWVSFPITFSVR